MSATRNKLAAYLAECRSQPFRWGVFDCCTFAAGAVRAMTGRDYFAEFGVRYRTKREAVAILRAHGGVEGIADSFLSRVTLQGAQRGDVLAFDGRLGVYVPPWGLFAGSDGIKPVSLEYCDAAWRVG